MSKEITLPDDVMIVTETDERGIIVYANDDFCKIAGYTADELVGKPHNIVRHIDMPRAAFKDLWDTIKTGKIWNGYVKNKSKNGDFYWVYATVSKSVNVAGQVRYISVRVKPEIEHIERSEKLYKTLN